MTIKKQLTLLSFFIIVIPIACAVFIRVQSYITNRQQYMINGTQKINYSYSEKLTENDLEQLNQKIKLLPSDVQCLLVKNSGEEIMYSSFPEYYPGNKIIYADFVKYIKSTSDIYFYQFTVPQINSDIYYLITRIPHKKYTPQKRINFIRIIMLVLIALVSICFIMVIFLSKTIFTSIIKIENKTQQLADGKLSEKLISENDNSEKNEITSIMKSLEKMRLSIIEIINRKNKFIMGISHDLRTPVAVIKGYSEAISDGVITSPQEISKSLEIIEGRTAQLSEMIDSLINYMKLNDYEMRQKLTPGSISQIIKDFAKSSALVGNVFKRNIISNINIPDNIQVPLNEQLVYRSFENLFSNSLRYTKDNDTIEINSYLNTDNSIILEIKDTGIGIEEKDLRNIFDLFYRGSNSRREEGMGIGLSVVKNIMDTHGWTISVESEIGKGTCFSISIPTEQTI